MDGQRKKHNIRKKNYVSGVAVIILMNIAAWLSVDFCEPTTPLLCRNATLSNAFLEGGS